MTMALMTLCLAMSAQKTRTTETQRDKYGRITGRSESVTHSDGRTVTTYRDQYGRITGKIGRAHV